MLPEIYIYIYITGDFNLKLFDWNECKTPESPPCHAYSQMKDLIDRNFLTQLVLEPTRKKRILDLVITNVTQEVIEMNISDVKLSDHKMVECILSHNPLKGYIQPFPEWEEGTFRAINYHKADFPRMNEDLQDIDWASLQSLCEKNGGEDGSAFKDMIVSKVLEVTQRHSPAKQTSKRSNKGRLERELNSLKMKRRKINGKIRAMERNNPNSANLPKLNQEVSHITYQIKDNIISRLNEKELFAVKAIKSNPKFFFSYAKRFAKAKSTIAPLRNSEGSLSLRRRQRFCSHSMLAYLATLNTLTSKNLSRG